MSFWELTFEFYKLRLQISILCSFSLQKSERDHICYLNICLKKLNRDFWILLCWELKHYVLDPVLFPIHRLGFFSVKASTVLQCHRFALVTPICRVIFMNNFHAPKGICNYTCRRVVASALKESQRKCLDNSPHLSLVIFWLIFNPLLDNISDLFIIWQHHPSLRLFKFHILFFCCFFWRFYLFGWWRFLAWWRFFHWRHWFFVLTSLHFSILLRVNIWFRHLLFRINVRLFLCSFTSSLWVRCGLESASGSLLWLFFTFE